MRGYISTSYGDGFADVYDDWYGDVTDASATAALVASLVPADAEVLELGVGTGRIAVPMADAGLRVTGIDSSQAMLDRLSARTDRVTSICGDMVDDLPSGPFDAALAAYNTLFNLLDVERQQACFRAVAERLRPNGVFVVEAAVPDESAPDGTNVAVRSMSVDRVVLSVSDHRRAEQATSGQFVEFTEAGGVRLRPWAVRWTTVAELDDMAGAAGLSLLRRHGDVSGAAFDVDSAQHVSVYRRPA